MQQSMGHEQLAGLGQGMSQDMAEQASVLRSIVDRRSAIHHEVRRLSPYAPIGVVLVARGSSGHAAIFGRYAFEVALERPAMLASPSLLAVPGSNGDYRGYVAVACSQSGQTVDVIEALAALQRLGATGIAVTNEPDSELAATSDLVIPIEAGTERAIPATKTVSGTMAVLLVLAESLGRPHWRGVDWHRATTAVEAVLEAGDPAPQVAATIDAATTVACVGRGYHYPVALEAALKLKEAGLVHAQGYSTIDFLHGPIVTSGPRSPVIVVGDAAEPASQQLAQRLTRHKAARLLVDSSERAQLKTPSGLPPVMAAFPKLVALQQLSLAVARRRSLDPDAPVGLAKVTVT